MNLLSLQAGPVLFYGAGIWGLSEQKKINTVQNKACRYFLGLGKNAANIASQGDMGWTSCNMKQKIESCRLHFKIQCTDDNRLVKKKCFVGPVRMVNHGKVDLRTF